MSKVARATALALVILLLQATIVAAYLYKATYTIVNTAATTYTMLPVTVDSANTWMSTNGFMSSTALDTRVETPSGTVYPHMVADDRTLTTAAVPATSQVNLYFTTGNSALSSMDVVFGQGGYATVADAAALELADEFTVDVPAYIKTDVANRKPFVVKPGSFFLGVTSTGNIAAAILTATNLGQTYDADDNPRSVTTTTWLAQTFTPAVSGFLDSVRVRLLDTNPSTGVLKAAIYDVSGGAPTGSPIAVGYFDLAAVSQVVPGNLHYIYFDPENSVWLVSGTQYALVLYPLDLGGAGFLYWRYHTAGVYAGGTALDSTDSGATWTNHAGEDYTFYAYTYEDTVDASVAATSGYHRVKAVANAAANTLNLSTYNSAGTLEATSGDIGTGGAACPDNANSWYFGSQATPYADYFKLHTSANVVDAGNAATNRADDYSAGFTVIDLANPAAATGIIDTVQLYAGNNMTGVRVGTFYLSAGTTYVCRDSVSILGTVVAGATQTYTDLELDVVSGDYIGAYFATGTLDAAQVGLSGTRSVAGENIDPGESASYALDGAAWGISLYAYSTAQAWYMPAAIVANTAGSATTLTADAGGSRVALVDAALTQANDYWNGARLNIVTTTDGLAPQGETSIVTDFVAATDTLSMYPLTAAVEAGDTYTIDFGTLVDREGTAPAGTQNGVITWGSNPAGVTVTLGGLVSSSQPNPGTTTSDPTPDILPSSGTSNWFTEPDVSGTLLTNPMRPFVTILSDTTTLTELQAWRLLGLALVLFVLVLTAKAVRSHLLVSGIATGAAIGGLVALTIWPLWTLVFVIGAVAAGVVAERASI